MTEINGNRTVTVLSNPDHDPQLPQLLHLALLRTEAGEIRHHSGAYGPVQGWNWTRGVLRPEDQDALYDALYDGLIVICVPRVKDTEGPRAVPPRWLRLITLGVPPVTGNPVRITGMGWVRLSAMNASAVLVSAA